MRNRGATVWRALKARCPSLHTLFRQADAACRCPEGQGCGRTPRAVPSSSSHSPVGGLCPPTKPGASQAGPVSPLPSPHSLKTKLHCKTSLPVPGVSQRLGRGPRRPSLGCRGSGEGHPLTAEPGGRPHRAGRGEGETEGAEDGQAAEPHRWSPRRPAARRGAPARSR